MPLSVYSEQSGLVPHSKEYHKFAQDSLLIRVAPVVRMYVPVNRQSLGLNAPCFADEQHYSLLSKYRVHRLCDRVQCINVPERLSHQSSGHIVVSC